jgi:RNA polymerase subunit RPABC4/transcription elongation factor Spt4
MYCSKCGKQVPDDANFCTNCGTRLHAIVDTTAEKDVVSNDDKSSTTSMPTTKKTLGSSRYGSVRASSSRYGSGCGRQMSGNGNVCPSSGNRLRKPYNIREKLLEGEVYDTVDSFLNGVEKACDLAYWVYLFIKFIGSIIGVLLIYFLSQSL